MGDRWVYLIFVGNRWFLVLIEFKQCAEILPELVQRLCASLCALQRAVMHLVNYKTMRYDETKVNIRLTRQSQRSPH